MKIAAVGVVLGWMIWATVVSAAPGPAAPVPREVRPELEYLKAVIAAAPPRDPQLLVLLLWQFDNANQPAEGIEFLSARLAEFGPRLSDAERAYYVAAIAVLRATLDRGLPAGQRAAWAAETARRVAEAKRLAGGDVFAIRWLAGAAEGDREALVDLAWCAEHADQAANPGWLRPVYAHLAAIHRRQGRPDQAAELQALSGLPEADSRLTFTVASATDPTTGLPIGPRRITEVVPGTVYALSGFDFAELYFVVSRDRRQLIAIDAGTRPDTVKAAYEALRARVPGLPAPTTVLITHAHFDHIGGRSFFERLAPRPTFYARQNYAVELAVQADGPPNPALRRPPAPAGPPPTPPAPFRPDVLIDRRTDLAIGGTRIELVPIRGGETVDAMLVHLPDLGVMFVGDFAMVLLGSPYRDEGNLDGLFEAIDEVARRNPKILLHGHAALTQTFGAASLLVRLEAPLAWLRDQTVAGIRRGAERGQLQQANLIAPGVLQDPELQLPYLLFRESVINRIYDQRVGPWQPDLAGVDVLTQADRGALLVDYLGVTEPRLVAAVQKLTADGRYELAATALEWAAPRYPRSAALQDAQRFVYQKLTEKYQSVNIFKFMLYAAKAGEVLGPVGAAR